MATTIGIKLYVLEKEDDTIPGGGMTSAIAGTIDTPVLGVQNIPEIQTAPSGIDTTSLEDTEEQSEPGLISGSSLAITMNYKEGVYSDGTEDKSNFEQLLKLSNDNVHAWKIELPNGRYFAFYGKVRATIGAMAVASAQQFTATLFKKSKVLVGFNTGS